MILAIAIGAAWGILVSVIGDRYGIPGKVQCILLLGGCAMAFI